MGFADWHKRVMGGAKGLVAHPPIAVDFGVGALKILQIAPGEPPTLIAAACLPTPDDLLGDASKRLAFQLEALPKLTRGIEFKGRRAVCSIPASVTLVKHMQLQSEPNLTLATLVEAAIPGQLGCDPGAIIHRHVEVGQIGRKTEVICMAAARDTISRLMQGIKAAKLEPVGMHCEHHALLRAFDSITRRSEDANLMSVYLDMGAGATKVAIARGRDLVFARTIDLGGRHLDRAVAGQLKLDAAQAREYRLRMAELSADARRPAPHAVPHAAPQPALTGGDGGLALAEDRRHGAPAPGLTPELNAQPLVAPAPAQADLHEPLEILTDEISMCLRYYESVFPDQRVGRTVFVGGEARHVGLCQHVARSLRLPAQVGDPMAGIARSGQEPTIGVDFTRPQPGWTVALGLCLSPTDL
jgi:Tfp pilus assembly PilM family ATPase